MKSEKNINSEKKILVLCANLKKRPDRRFVINHNLENLLRAETHFIEAVDGDYVPEWKLEHLPKGATKSNYAVRLTKRLALRRFLSSGKKFLLYLEDDVAITEDFKDTVFEGMTRMHDVIFLGGDHQKQPDGEGRWRKCRATFNNHALLFSRKGAKITQKILSDWRHAWSDRELQLAISENRIEAWCVHPPVAYQRTTKSDNSGNTGVASLAKVPNIAMAPDDFAVLDVALNFSKIVIEYGSGSSTIHMGSRLENWGHLVSIEHDSFVFKRVEEMLSTESFPVVQILKTPTPPWKGAEPTRCFPGQLASYISAPNTLFGKGAVDLVIVKGRERVRCALNAANLLRPGGYLMFHRFWQNYRYRTCIAELLRQYEYLFETPEVEGTVPGGMAVFRKSDAVHRSPKNR